MDIQIIQRLITDRRYQIKIHTMQHALQERFGERQIVEAILAGQIIETYPERRRVLIVGMATFEPDTQMYLHVVCEQNYPDQIEIVTAYIPGVREWGTPPFKRKFKKR